MDDERTEDGELVVRYDEDLTDGERATTPMVKVVYGPDFRLSKAQAKFLGSPRERAIVPVGGGRAAGRTLTVREMAKLGGHARWAKLSPERRSEIARQAARKRWAKKEG